MNDFLTPALTPNATPLTRTESALQQFKELSWGSNNKTFLETRTAYQPNSPIRPLRTAFQAFPDQQRSPSRLVNYERNPSLTPTSLSDQRQSRQVRLSDITERLSGMDKHVEKKTYAQLQAETTRIAVFKEALQALERKVEAEIRDRIESHKTLSQDCESQLHNMSARLLGMTDAKFGDLDVALRDIDQRTSDLLNRLQQLEDDKTIDLLKAEIAQCHQEVMYVKAQLPQLIEERSAEFNNRVQSIEDSIARKFEEERVSRSKKMEELTADAVTLQQTLQERSRTFQKTMALQLEELRTMLDEERAQREQADDDIVLALNQYTVALHNALVKNGADREN